MKAIANILGNDRGQHAAKPQKHYVSAALERVSYNFCEKRSAHCFTTAIISPG